MYVIYCDELFLTTSMHLLFYGAAQTVTGSKHLVTIRDHKILLDCGMFQGRLENIKELNSTFPYEPGSVDFLLLSHAHIDHSGLIPYFVRKGFKGTIYATHATKDLAQVLLMDSAKIQMADAEYMNKRIDKMHLDMEYLEPLYIEPDVEQAMKLFTGLAYGETQLLVDDIYVTFYDAGHILGSSIVVLEDRKEGKKLVFTGDLGRKGLPILKDPVQIEQADILLTESTYGNREHDSVANMEEDMARVISTTIGRGGKVLIPAFSIGRTQELIYLLHRLWNMNKLPRVPIFVDSPLSTDATEIFIRHPECYDKETFDQFLLQEQNPFHFSNVTYIRSVEDSKALGERTEPCIIISASGMCENGRVLHHLKKILPDYKNTVMAVGYMAQGTVGRRLIEGDKQVTIHGKQREVHASIEKMNSFSAHADKHELLAYAAGIKGLKQIFLVHGETEQSIPFAEELRKLPGVQDVTIAEPFQEVDV